MIGTCDTKRGVQSLRGLVMVAVLLLVVVLLIAGG